jgi:hypothetical protein
MRAIRPIIVVILTFLIYLPLSAAPLKAGQLISFKKVSHLTKAEQNKILADNQLGKFTPVKYPVNAYRVIYGTNEPNGKIVSASGMLVIPEGVKKPLDVVSYSHGTATIKNKVPSNPTNPNGRIYSALFGGAGGFIVTMPDYLGMGKSGLPLHPYLQSNTLASSAINLIIASQQVAKRLNANMTSRIFVGGYSEGGLAAMEVSKFLQTRYSDRFKLVASAPASGPYDLTYTLKLAFLYPSKWTSIYIAYFVLGLHDYYGYWPNLNKVFKPRYIAKLKRLFDGHYSFQQIADQLPARPAEMFQRGFYKKLFAGKNKAFMAMLKKYNNYDWVPQTPMWLIGAGKDFQVPFINSKITYQFMKYQAAPVRIVNIGSMYGHHLAEPSAYALQLECFMRYRSYGRDFGRVKL